MNEEMKKGYYMAQADMLHQLMRGFNHPERWVAYLADMTGLSKAKVSSLLEKYMENDKLYEAYTKEFDTEDAVYFWLWYENVGTEYLAYKYHMTYEEAEARANRVPSPTVAKVYKNLMKKDKRTYLEEQFCRKYTADTIASVILSVVTALKRYNVELQTIEETMNKKFIALMLMSKDEINRYAQKLVLDNVDKETGIIEKNANEILSKELVKNE